MKLCELQTADLKRELEEHELDTLGIVSTEAMRCTIEIFHGSSSLCKMINNLKEKLFQHFNNLEEKLVQYYNNFNEKLKKTLRKIQII